MIIPLVCDVLSKLAATKMASERSDHTLDATVLVDEMYLRLVGDQHFDSKGHFFTEAAEAMRRVLSDHSGNRAKRSTVRQWVDLDRLIDLASATDDDLISIDEALHRLARLPSRR